MNTPKLGSLWKKGKEALQRQKEALTTSAQAALSGVQKTVRKALMPVLATSGIVLTGCGEVPGMATPRVKAKSGPTSCTLIYRPQEEGVWSAGRGITLRGESPYKRMVAIDELEVDAEALIPEKITEEELNSLFKELQQFVATVQQGDLGYTEVRGEVFAYGFQLLQEKYPEAFNACVDTTDKHAYSQLMLDAFMKRHDAYLELRLREEGEGTPYFLDVGYVKRSGEITFGEEGFEIFGNISKALHAEIEEAIPEMLRYVDQNEQLQPFITIPETIGVEEVEKSDWESTISGEYNHGTICVMGYDGLSPTEQTLLVHHELTHALQDIDQEFHVHQSRGLHRLQVDELGAYVREVDILMEKGTIEDRALWLRKMTHPQITAKDRYKLVTEAVQSFAVEYLQGATMGQMDEKEMNTLLGELRTKQVPEVFLSDGYWTQWWQYLADRYLEEAVTAYGGKKQPIQQ